MKITKQRLKQDSKDYKYQRKCVSCRATYGTDFPEDNRCCPICIENKRKLNKKWKN